MFRGCIDDLESQNISLKLYEEKVLIAQVERKVVPH